LAIGWLTVGWAILEQNGVKGIETIEPPIFANCDAIILSTAMPKIQSMISPTK